MDTTWEDACPKSQGHKRVEEMNCVICRPHDRLGSNEGSPKLLSERYHSVSCDSHSAFSGKRRGWRRPSSSHRTCGVIAIKAVVVKLLLRPFYLVHLFSQLTTCDVRLVRGTTSPTRTRRRSKNAKHVLNAPPPPACARTSYFFAFFC